MITRIALLWTRLQNSLWGLPIALCLAGAALAIVALRVRLRAGGDPVWWLYSGDAADASVFISNLLGAMITMATLAISITMVVLALAAQSLGPRLIPIFMSDNRTKLSLGLFLGTVVYLLLALRSVVGDADAVSNLAVTISVLLVLISVIVLLFFVHHLARSIVADTVIERVGQALDGQVRDLLTGESGKHKSLTPAARKSFQKEGEAIASPAAGYIQAIDYPAIGHAAADRNAVVLLAVRPGHHVLAGELIGWIKPRRAGNEVLSKAVQKSFILGRDRTSTQDLEYSIRQLVEIALRALSPGINDPHTATAVIDRLSTSIALIMNRADDPGIWCDDEGTVRIHHPSASFAALLDSASSEIRHAGSSNPEIMIALAKRSAQLYRLAPQHHRKAIAGQLTRLRKTGLRTLKDPMDRQLLLTSLNVARA